MHTLQLTWVLLSLASLALSCSSVSGVKFTAYGFPDASGTPAYACNGNTVVASQPGGKTVLGDGSFGKPYSAAAAGNSVFAKCQLLYIPLLKKYFRIQDDCSGCGKFELPPPPMAKHLQKGLTRDFVFSRETSRSIHRAIQL